MPPTQVSPRDPSAFGSMSEILSAALASGSPRYTIHPGDLAWWVHHADPRTETDHSYWLDDNGFAELDTAHAEVAAFAAPGESPLALIEWACDQLGPGAKVSFVSDRDHDLESGLEAAGFEVAEVSGPVFTRDLPSVETEPPPGWKLRPLTGEAEADARRRASHRAFQSSMDPADHLERYLRFMRSPVYRPEHDLVAVAPDGTVGAFTIWWPDPCGIAEIEPFGTDPGYQRRGLGRALMKYAWRRMSEAGMTTARVVTDAHRSDAVAFYEGVGFTEVAALRSWARP